MSSRTAGWIVGGLLVATGVINLLFSFGTPYGDIALSLDKVGNDAIGDLGTTGRFMISVFCLGIGIPTLVSLNATQWKNTGGY